MHPQNEALLAAFLEKVRQDYAQDIQLVFIYGSAARGDDHDKSDIDLVFVPKNGRGQALAMSFLVGDIGYDFFPMSWARLEKIASFEEPLVPVLAQAKIVYAASREHEERFEQLRGWIIDMMSVPMCQPILERAKAEMERAMTACARMQIATTLGDVRTGSASAVYAMMQAICVMNNRFFQGSTAGHLEELLSMRVLPDDFAALYQDVLEAKAAAGIRKATWALLSATQAVYASLAQKVREEKPYREVFPGTYEESWCNWRQKIAKACAAGDAGTAFLSGVCYQQFLDEIAGMSDLARIDVMRYYQADDLAGFGEAVEKALAHYRGEMEKRDVPLAIYDSVDAFRAALAEK